MTESDIIKHVMSKNKRTTNWLTKHKNDPFVKKSKKDNYRSRAVYKLIEINEKYKIFSNSTFVIDLGCCPGSWSQYASKQKNIKKIVGIDVLEMTPINLVDFIQGDINNPEILQKVLFENKCKAGVVLSDIAPNITGIGVIDQGNFTILADTVMEFCTKMLKEDGFLIMKYFSGSSSTDVQENLKKHFRKVSVFKPASSKKISNEIYLICNNFKPLI
ncbi:MAG: RlmE family RNA methyltransferase [Pseudomonadota bacterium]|nr:RlmE family RNA methyltransferase [Pseudomonadota bacterium]MEC8996308.1 RlmE family RNA methyltransferase [Pseudomonadota bacterium]